MKKLFTSVLAIAFAMSLTLPASALTVAEIQAQIAQLQAALAALTGGASVGAGVTFSVDLTIGSRGTDVTALQNWLISKGFSIPAGATGYFGTQTRAAVAAWQASANISPAVGYFGPISRGVVNAVVGPVTPGPVACPAGYTCAPTGSTGGGITTPGAEGTLTVSKNPSPAAGTKMYEGDSQVGVLGIKLEAALSDIRVERVKVDLDHVTGTTLADQNLYNKIASKIYAMDGSTVLASSDLNSSTVVKDGSNYFITITGINFLVPKGTTKVLSIGLDARSNWDTDFDTETWSLGVPVDGVRGLDGAGINQYGPATAFTNNFTTEGNLAESATLTISTASDTPLDSEKICTLSSSEDECDRLEVLRMNFKAEKDDVLITDITSNIQKTDAGTATTTTAYIYDGSTLVGSATVLNFSGQGSAVFSDIDWTVPKDTTKTFSLQLDIRDAVAGPSVFSASTTAANVTSENTTGTGATESGNAIGESVTVRNVGPEFTLLSKNVTYTTSGGFAGATSTAKADFTLRVKAVGADIEFGDSASTTYALAGGFPSGAAGTSTIIYRGGASALTDGVVYVSSSTSITVPSGVTAAVGANSWILAEGNTVDIPVSFVFNGRSGNTGVLGSGAEITTGAYAVGLERLNWITNAAAGGKETSTFMAGNSAWRTGTVTMP